MSPILCLTLLYYLARLQVKDFILGTGGSGGPMLFSDDELATLVECLPTAEEAELLGSHAKDAANLGIAENFLLAMLTIPKACAAPDCPLKHALGERG